MNRKTHWHAKLLARLCVRWTGSEPAQWRQGARLGCCQRGDTQYQQQRAPVERAVKSRRVRNSAAREVDQQLPIINVQQHSQGNEHQLGRQPRAIKPIKNQHCPQQHGNRGSGSHQIEVKRLPHGLELPVIGIVLAAGDEQAGQEKKPGEPDSHCCNVEKLQPENHAVAPKFCRPWASACRDWVLRLFALPNTAILLPLAWPPFLFAHVSDTTRAPTGFDIDILLRAVLFLGLLLYGIGLRRLWRNGLGRGVSVMRAGATGIGWAVLVLALISPLDRWAQYSLAAHVAQHMLLMALVPPLLLIGLPGAVVLGLLPTRAARTLSAPILALRQHAAWRWLIGPVAATLVQAAVMWGWHLPSAMAIALRHNGVHWLMHTSFLAAGLWFWVVLLRSVREPRLGVVASAVAVVGSMMAMGLLGALMTLADAPRYADYIEHARLRGFNPLHDQQLAGLIMWVPSMLPYLIGGLALVAMWLRRGERL